MTVSAPAWSPPRPPGRHAGPWVSPAVPVELRPRHTGRGPGAGGRDPPQPGGAGRAFRPLVAGLVSARVLLGSAPPTPARGCASPGERRPHTHPPTPASTDAPRPALPEGRAHRDLPLQRQGAPGVDLSRTGCTGVEPSRKWCAQRPPPGTCTTRPSPVRPPGRTPVPVPGGMGRACTSLGTSPRGWPGKQGGREWRQIRRAHV